MGHDLSNYLDFGLGIGTLSIRPISLSPPNMLTQSDSRRWTLMTRNFRVAALVVSRSKFTLSFIIWRWLKNVSKLSKFIFVIFAAGQLIIGSIAVITGPAMTSVSFLVFIIQRLWSLLIKADWNVSTTACLWTAAG